MARAPAECKIDRPDPVSPGPGAGKIGRAEITNLGAFESERAFPATTPERPHRLIRPEATVGTGRSTKPTRNLKPSPYSQKLERIRCPTL
jgi:hypothetical protein